MIEDDEISNYYSTQDRIDREERSKSPGLGPRIPGWFGPEVDLGGCVSWSKGDYCVYATQGYECSPSNIAVQINHEGAPHRGDLALAGHVPLHGRTRDEAIRHLFDMLNLGSD